MIQVTVARLVVDRKSGSPVVVLQEQEGDRVLPIWIGTPEAAAIATELQGLKPARPMTHDLLKHLLLALDGDLRRVSILSLQDRTYHAELVIRTGERHVTVDARPSDAIALALRCRVPIHCEERLLVAADVEQSDAPTGSDDAARSADDLRRYLEGLDPEDFGKFTP